MSANVARRLLMASGLLLASGLAGAAGCGHGHRERRPPGVNPGPSPPRCLLSSDGQQACGYKCMLGSDGHAACANTPDGVCALGSNGRVECSQVAQGGSVAGASPPQCRMSSSGTNVCGYNCEYASSGDVSCASRPDARCAHNSDGTLTCP